MSSPGREVAPWHSEQGQPQNQRQARIQGLGLILPTFPQGSDEVPGAAELGMTAQAAEIAGASALWACDHLFWHRPSLECMMALALAASHTKTSTIGTCVMQLPLRPAALVAKQAAGLQHLAGGRFVLGVGVGSHEGEYRAVGARYETRGQDLDRSIQQMRALWGAGMEAETGAEGDSQARQAETERVYLQLPAPAPIPIWVGGSSTASLDRAARLGNGWIPLFMTPSSYSAANRELEERAEKLGRDPAEITRAVVLFVAPSSSASGGNSIASKEAGLSWMSSLYGLPPRAFARHLVSGTAPQVADQIHEYFEAGAQHVALFVADDRPVDAFSELCAAEGELTLAREDAGTLVP